jgi:hypothetical protein
MQLNGLESSYTNEVPARLIWGNRPVDNKFRFFHCLYHRCTREDIADGRLLGARVKANCSVNWSKYSKPWDVVFDHPGWGIAQFVVCLLPKTLPKEMPTGAKAKAPQPHSFYPEHDPCPLNYPHCEIRTFRAGLQLKGTNLPATVKKEFRQLMSDRSVILLDPDC